MFFEPTSVSKATRAEKALPLLSFVKPNIYELEAMLGSQRMFPLETPTVEILVELAKNLASQVGLSRVLVPL